VSWTHRLHVPEGVTRYRGEEPGSFADFDDRPERYYRYALGRHWSEEVDAVPLVWVMLNPSTADQDEDDATIRKCIGFAKEHHFGAILVVNLFAAVKTDPRALLKLDDPVGLHADAYLERALDLAGHGAHVVAAWGDVHRLLGRRAELWSEPLRAMHARCLGKTRRGSPRHPSRLAYATPMEAL